MTEETENYQTQYPHGMLPEISPEEFSHQEFVKSLKIFLATDVAPGNAMTYEKEVLPAFRAEHGRDPEDRHEIKAVMEKNDYYRR